MGAVALPFKMCVMDSAEGIVRLRREAQKKAAELIPALFLDMFGDPAMNPKGWPIFRLGDIAEVVSGVAKGRKFNGKQTVTASYLRVANVQAGFIQWFGQFSGGDRMKDAVITKGFILQAIFFQDLAFG